MGETHKVIYNKEIIQAWRGMNLMSEFIFSERAKLGQKMCIRVVLPENISNNTMPISILKDIDVFNKCL